MELVEIFKQIDIWLNDFLMNMGLLAPILSSLLIILEGILAPLPLFVFVTINVLTIGPIFGTILSWICTTIGSFCAFLLFRAGLSKGFNKLVNKKIGVKNFMKKVDKLSFSQLVLIISIPFSPSFFINMAAGLSKINKKKYFYALLLGKTIDITFLAFMGYSLVECLTNPYVFIKLIIMLVVAYIISLIVNKYFNLDERF